MQSFVLRIVDWLFAEVILTALGIDDMADYSEYVFKSRSLLASQQLAFSEFVHTNKTYTPWETPFTQSTLFSRDVVERSSLGVTLASFALPQK